MTKEVKARENTLHYIDTLKGVAIVLVLIGHRSFHPNVTYFIYLFHMPLFFFLSGFLDKMKYQSWGEIVRKKGARLLYPYVVFGILILIYNTVFDLVMGNITEDKLWKRIVALVYGNCIWENNSDYIGTLWFLVALFIASLFSYIIYQLSSKQNKVLMISICLFLLLAGAVSSCVKQKYGIRLPWCMDVAFVATLFYLLGIWWRTWEGRKKLETIFVGMTLFVIGTVLGLLNMYYMKANDYADLRIDMLNMNYGILPVFVISAGAMSVGALIICKRFCSKCRLGVFEWFGKLSLLIMIDHIYIFQIFNLALNKLEINYWLLFFPICLFLSVSIAAIIQRFLPFLYDSKRLMFIKRNK